MPFLHMLNQHDVLSFKDPIVVIPIASIEAHGPLPLGFDILFAECLLKILDTHIDELLIVPPIPISTSYEHSECGPTATVTCTTFSSYLKEFLTSLSNYFSKFIVAVFHGGAYHCIYVAIREILQSNRNILIKIFNPYQTISKYLEEIGLRNYIVHADPIEASIALACNINVGTITEVETIDDQVLKRYTVKVYSPWLCTDIADRYRSRTIVGSHNLGAKLLSLMIHDFIELVKELRTLTNLTESTH